MVRLIRGGPRARQRVLDLLVRVDVVERSERAPLLLVDQGLERDPARLADVRDDPDLGLHTRFLTTA